ncbi:MAG: major tail protein [Lokiarchaeia virus VerdaV1]|uniref:Major tail protein n=1 Tax=Lokiarchaeia virus VerdaV1 TaxID=3070170 RepID=A0AA35G9Q8_9CAUD|nr:MAG: major tail protein [Lokiarchaeia virus VerdaV1]BDI54860.1 MAG: major tail protein [Lokiarchaeia virus VerdaV1]
MVYQGKSSYAYWGIEAGGYGLGNPATDAHIPFNPILKLSIPRPEHVIIEEKTCNSLETSIVYSEELKPDEIEIETIFRDPFLLCATFTKKTVTDSWTGTDDVITGDFTAETHNDYIWAHYYIYDATAPIEKTLKGGKIISYRLLIVKNKPIKEIVKIKFATITDESVAMNVTTTFHDDFISATIGWAFWAAIRYYSPTGSSISTATSYIADPEMKYDEIEFIINVLETFEYDTSAKSASYTYHENREYMARLKGKITGEALETEIELDPASRSRDKIFRLTFATGLYLQFTNAMLFSLTKLEGIEAGKAIEQEAVFKGMPTTAGVVSACSMSLTYSIAQDPDAMITN